MKAGVLGVVDGSFDAVGSYSETVTEGEHELDRALAVDRVFSLPSGEMGFSGRAASETVADHRTTAIGNGEISVTEETRTVTRFAEFVGVPGEFVVVDRGDGTFAFDLVAAETDAGVDRAELDLDEFFASHGSATPWKAGFSGTGGNGLSGTFHGDDLRTVHDIDAILAESELNQVGLTYENGGDEVKMMATRSGYVEVYRPSAFDSGEFLTYLHEEIVPYVR